MRRLLTLGVAWLVAAVVATTVAWQGVGLVGDQVTDDRPPTLSADDVEEAVAGSGDGGTTPPTTRSEPSSTVPPTTSSTAPSTAITTVPDPAPVTRSYDLTGGSAALRFSPSGVRVVFARPKPGYRVRSEPSDDGGWRIDFDGDAGRSRVEGWWDGGPQERVDDDGESGSGSGDDGGGSGSD